MSAGVAAARRQTALDLFSGSGNATAAFAGGRGWRVVTVDLDRSRRPAVVADVRALPFRPTWTVDFLWASPPCEEFSDARAGVDRREVRPSLDLVFAALAAVRTHRPRWWAIENVRGAIPFLGIPAAKVGPWCLWGYFPPLRPPLEAQVHRKMAHRSAAARAAVPPALARAVFEAVERWGDQPAILDLRPFRRHRHRAARQVDGRTAQGEIL